MSNHSDSSYRLTGDDQQPTAEVQDVPMATASDNGTPPVTPEGIGLAMPAETTVPRDSASLHGSAERLSYADEARPMGLRFGLLMQIIKVFNSKFSGDDGKNIDEWFNELMFFIRPHELSSAEKAYVLVNSVKGRAFTLLTEGDSTNFEQLKALLLSEFRSPGAYWKAIQSFSVARQGKNQKVSGFYHFLTKKVARINEMYRERHGMTNGTVSSHATREDLVKEDLAIAIFLQGLGNIKIREQLTSMKPTCLKDVYDQACLYEDVFKDSGMKRSMHEERSDRPVKKAFKGKYSSGDKYNGDRSSKQYTPPTTYNKPGMQAGNKPTAQRDLSAVQCYKCQQYGHYAKECPNKRVGAVTVLEEEVALLKTDKSSEVFAKAGPQGKAIPVTIDK